LPIAQALIRPRYEVQLPGSFLLLLRSLQYPSISSLYIPKPMPSYLLSGLAVTVVTYLAAASTGSFLFLSLTLAVGCGFAVDCELDFSRILLGVWPSDRDETKPIKVGNLHRLRPGD
jgi:hypothetical protein